MNNVEIKFEKSYNNTFSFIFSKEAIFSGKVKKTFFLDLK